MTSGSFTMGSAGNSWGDPGSEVGSTWGDFRRCFRGRCWTVNGISPSPPPSPPPPPGALAPPPKDQVYFEGIRKKCEAWCCHGESPTILESCGMFGGYTQVIHRPSEELHSEVIKGSEEEAEEEVSEEVAEARRNMKPDECCGLPCWIEKHGGCLEVEKSKMVKMPPPSPPNYWAWNGGFGALPMDMFTGNRSPAQKAELQRWLIENDRMRTGRG